MNQGEQAEMYEWLRDGIVELLDPPDDDAAEEAILLAAVEECVRERDAALDLLRYACDVEDESCQFDHHGYCQDHPHSGSDPDDGTPCWFVRARALLAAHPEEES